MNDPHEKQKLDVEGLSLREIIHALTLKQAIAIVSFAGALAAASFAFGLRWEAHLRSAEVQPLKARLEIANANAKKLDDELHFLRKKEQFLELTATLQFQAMLLGKDLQELYPSGVQRLAISEAEYMSHLERYSRVIDELTHPANGRDPVADLRVPRVPPKLLVFRNDNTTWIPLRTP